MDTEQLDRIRRLLAKAEATTPHEAEALTQRAAELMAKYGIDRALLGRLHPETDSASDRMILMEAPRADIKSFLLGGLAGAMRCTPILLTGGSAGKRIHLFGYRSDLERVDVLYTSLLLQMEVALLHATLGGQRHDRERAWRRSFLIGFCQVVVERVRAAEANAEETAVREDAPGMSTALVLADRKLVVQRRMQAAYPRTRRTRVTYSGNGYADGREAGKRADIAGGNKVGGGTRGRLGR